MKHIDRTTQILLASLVIGMWALVVRSFDGPGPANATKSPPAATFDEITVKRINVVADNGKPRLVLATAERLPGSIVAGEELPRSIRPAGILFYDEDGTECGGIALSRAKDGTHQRTLTFDYTRQETDDIAVLMREKPDNPYSTGFILFDRLPLGSDVRKSAAAALKEYLFWTIAKTRRSFWQIRLARSASDLALIMLVPQSSRYSMLTEKWFTARHSECTARPNQASLQLTPKAFARHGGQAEQARWPARRPDFHKFYASASTDGFLLRTAIACCSSSKSNGLDIIMSTLSSS